MSTAIKWIVIKPGCELPKEGEIVWALIGGRIEGYFPRQPDWEIVLVGVDSGDYMRLDLASSLHINEKREWFTKIRAWCKYEEIQLPKEELKEFYIFNGEPV